ncbi:MAG: hypothetical protein V1776_01625 [Candidatus Diapherotrites archaeon]
MRIHGQTSVELLVVLVISVVLLAILIDFTTSNVSQLKEEHAVRLARQSLLSLVTAINQTYQSGNGTVKFVTVHWPEGIDANNTRIVGNTIILRVYQTDIVESAIPLLGGVFVPYVGEQRVKMTSYDSNVTLGSLSFSVSPAAIYLPMTQDSNTVTHLTVSNLSGESATFSYSLNWDHNQVVEIALDANSHLISGGGEAELDIIVSANGSAFGNYAGSMDITASFYSGEEWLSVPLDIEVYAYTTDLLSVYPAIVSIESFTNDSNYSTIQVCNNGGAPLKEISFTPSSGNPGSWIEGISSITEIEGQVCHDVDVTVTVPSGTGLGEYAGTFLVSDFTGANTQILPLNVSVIGQASSFEWDWSSASSTATTLSGFGIQNIGSREMTIVSLTLSRWWGCDTEHSILSSVTLDGNAVFSGSIDDGENANIDDTYLAPFFSSTNNAIVFGGTINDENEQFQARVTFSDNTQYTSGLYGKGCSLDDTPPSRVTDLLALSGPDPGSILLTFTFPGDDNDSGLASDVNFLLFKQPDANNPLVYPAGVIIPFLDTIQPGGSSGSLLVTDLNAGESYFFTAVFYDELDQNGGISNVAEGRPWNRFQYTQGDFNIATFAHSLTTVPEVGMPGDVNLFVLSDFVTAGSRDRNVIIRVTPDNNGNNSWIIALDVYNTTLQKIRIWYPTGAINGVPGRTPQYTTYPSLSISSGIDLLSSSLINSEYRYNGNLVSIPQENNLYLTFFKNFSDMNWSFDMGAAQYG